MMDYKEMAAIVRMRGDAILAKRAARSRLIKKISISVSGIAVSAAAALCIWNNKDIRNIPEREPVSSNIIADITTNSTSPTAVTTTVSAETAAKSTTKNTESSTQTAKSSTKTTESSAQTAKPTTKTTESSTQTAKPSTKTTESEKSVTTAANKGNAPSATTAVSSDNKGSTSTSSVSVSSQKTDTTVVSSTETIVTTTVTIAENEEVIRMKVEKIKRYLAVLSAAAITASPIQNVAAEEDSLYTPKPVSPELTYYLNIQNNPEDYDFNGNGKLDPYDSYALYTYINEGASVPDDINSRCRAKGDINDDCVFSMADFSLLFDMCMYNFFNEEYQKYSEGEANKKILCDRATDENSFYELFADNKRYLSSDCTPEEKEKYLCWFVHESYTYGSEKNIEGYLSRLYATTYNEFYSFIDRVKDLEYYYFTKETEEKNISFDINADGEISMKDAYDVYLYNCCLPYGNARRASFYYDIFNINAENLPIAEIISLSSEELEAISQYCEPLYDTAAKYLVYENQAMDLILRYIMTHSELTYNTLLSPYYASYRRVTIYDDEAVEQMFLLESGEQLFKYFDSSMAQFNENKSDKLTLSEKIDEEYLNDNESFRELLNKAKKDFESGKTVSLYDVNSDGKVDRYDEYIIDQFRREMFKGTPCKYSVVPEEIWNYLDKEFDIDEDGLAGDLIDLEVFTYIVGEKDEKRLTNYEKDLYFLDLIEQKGLNTTEEIEPFMSQLCSDKKTGDVNLDGMLTAVDASAVLTYYAQSSVNAEISCVTEAKMNYLADFNKDSIIDNRDASMILTEYAKNSVE